VVVHAAIVSAELLGVSCLAFCPASCFSQISMACNRSTSV